MDGTFIQPYLPADGRVVPLPQTECARTEQPSPYSSSSISFDVFSGIMRRESSLPLFARRCK